MKTLSDYTRYATLHYENVRRKKKVLKNNEMEKNVSDVDDK